MNPQDLQSIEFLVSDQIASIFFNRTDVTEEISEMTGSEKFRDIGGVITLQMYESNKPIIAAINGAAAGMGLTLTFAADVRIAAKNSKLGLVFAGRGIAPDGASSWFLSQLVGLGQALEWCLTASVFSTEEALQTGLISHVYEPEDVYPQAVKLAETMRDKTSPVASAMTRQLLWRMASADPYQAHDYESQVLAEIGSSDDVREGIQSFLERRPPRWQGSGPRDLPATISWPYTSSGAS